MPSKVFFRNAVNIAYRTPLTKPSARSKEQAMRRLISVFILAIMVALPSLAPAEGTGMYIAPKFLMSIQNTGPVSRSWALSGSGLDGYSQFSLGGALALGLDLWQQQMIPLRLEVEFALRSNAEQSWDDNGLFASEVKGTWNNSTLFANAFWDFHNDTPFTPYIGAGIGLAFNYTGYDITLHDGNSLSMDDRFTNLAWNAGAGFSYDVNEFLAFDASYRFVGLGYNEVSKNLNGVNYKIENEPYANEFLLGLRLNF